jgi:hypothetical protein
MPFPLGGKGYGDVGARGRERLGREAGLGDLVVLHVEVDVARAGAVASRASLQPA